MHFLLSLMSGRVPGNVTRTPSEIDAVLIWRYAELLSGESCTSLSRNGLDFCIIRVARIKTSLPKNRCTPPSTGGALHDTNGLNFVFGEVTVTQLVKRQYCEKFSRRTETGNVAMTDQSRPACWPCCSSVSSSLALLVSATLCSAIRPADSAAAIARSASPMESI